MLCFVGKYRCPVDNWIHGSGGSEERKALSVLCCETHVNRKRAEGKAWGPPLRKRTAKEQVRRRQKAKEWAAIMMVEVMGPVWARG